MAAEEARLHLITIAGPLRLGDSIQVGLRRVARATGLAERRVRAIWHREARRIDAVEMDRLRDAARDALALQEAHDAHCAVLARITAADEALGLPASDLDRNQTAARVGTASGSDRPLDRGGIAR